MITYNARAEWPYQVSSGCVVYRINDEKKLEILLQKKLGTLRNRTTVHTLPKGTLEHNETLEEAAVREVKEETGYDVILEAYLGGNQVALFNEHTQYDWDRMLHYYLARAVGGGPTQKKLELYEQFDIVWKDAHEAIELLRNDYKEQHIFVERALKYLELAHAHIST